MVNGHGRSRQFFARLFEKFKTERLAGRKRFNLSDLEDFLIQETGGISNYAAAGGYQGLYQLLEAKEASGEIRAIRNSDYNDRQPALKTRWQVEETVTSEWDESLVFKLSSRVDISYYLKRPEKQNRELLQQIMNIYNFLGEREKREWASREERSLELFADEKYLSQTAGKRLLSRLKLSLADLKAEKYAQMFVYWQQDTQIRKVLILENHSAFITCKRALAAGYPVISLEPDTLIYGGGKHIVRSLKFLEEIAEPELVNIYYAGDIDPAGLGIYTSLKDRYPDYSLALFVDYYQEMINRGGQGYPVWAEQCSNENVLNRIRTELRSVNRQKLTEDIENLWDNNLRIPQEVITYEVLKKESAMGF